MRLKTTVALAASAVVALGGLSACGSDDEAAGGSASTGGGEKGGTLKIGYAAALTGVLSPYETPFHNALKVAIDEANAAGGLEGRKIELTVKDAKSEIPVAAQVSQELVDGGAQILVTPCDADPSVAAGQAAQTAKIPAISSCAGSPRLPVSVGDFMFQNVFATNSQVVPLAQHAVDAGHKTVALLYSPDTRYTNDGPVQFAQVFEKLGGTVATKQTYKFGAQDFAAQVAKIKAAGPDVVMTSAYGADLATFLKQLRAAGVDTPVLGTDGADAPSLLTGGGKAAEGMVFTTHGMPVAEEPEVEAFAKLYKEKTGKDPESAFVYAAPDLIATLGAALAKTGGSVDGQKLRDAIDGLEGVEGTTGPITYAGMNRSPLKAVTLVEVKDGKFTFLDQVVPDKALIPAPVKG